jgi:valyl-tRNA synthetase
MRNIEPWCVSRQLWWGHRIPAWYSYIKPDGNSYRDDRSAPDIFVAETEEQAKVEAEQKYGFKIVIVKDADEAQQVAFEQLSVPAEKRVWPIFQDEDVLDTWFSSALWPFSTMGWPENTKDLQRFYPTHTLITGFDIIFFWVARMMMMGLHFTGQAPFKRVFINALVRDDKGQKMSKSKGNVMDPLVLIDEFGADALRFTLTAMSGQGRDIKLAKPRIEGYRNFSTKLWNATRFTQMNECARVEGFDPATAKLTLSRWIRGEVQKTLVAVTEALEACAFDDAANALYKFIWNVFCDWYLELAKPILNGDDAAAKAEIRAMTAWVLDQAMILLHPVMPFITEELWEKTGHTGMLIAHSWPKADAAAIDAEADEEINWLIDLISEIRSIRSEMNVPGSARAPLSLSGASEVTARRLNTHEDLILFLGRLSEVKVGDAAAGSVPFVAGEATAHLAIAEFIDLKAEQARLTKGIADFDKTIEGVRRKLDNPEFVRKAPEEVIAENRERLEEAENGKAKLSAALERLKAAS